jgi:hypothetical protein
MWSSITGCSSSEYNWWGASFASTGWLYVVEMLLKVAVSGFHNYWRSTQNRFDFAIIVTIGKSFCSARLNM